MRAALCQEPDIPAEVLKLLAMPVARNRQTWYLAASAPVAGAEARSWLLATLWNEPGTPGGARWGVALRGEALPALALPLADALADIAAEHGCTALTTAALELGSPFDLLLRQAGFTPARSYRTVSATTYAARRGMGLGVRGDGLQAAGWQLGAPRPEELPLLHAMFLHELGQIPPHLLHLAAAPAAARAMDRSLVLRRHGQVVAALAARQFDRTVDVQALVCHARWRAHRALSWLLAECAASWVWQADRVVFSFPDDLPGMADIARRIDAQAITLRHDLVRHLTP